MSEVAGRIEIEVSSDTSGFAAALKRKLEAITKEVTAKVRVEADTDRLKESIEKKVKQASKGVNAKIGVEIKKGAQEKLRTQLEVVVKAASEGITAKIGVDVDKDAAKKIRRTLRDTKRAVDIKAAVDKKGLLASWFAARRAVRNDAKRKPIELPLMPASFRSAFMPLFYTGIASLIQPLIGLIGGAVGGLTAMVGAAGQAVNTLAAAPTLLAGALGGFLSLKSVVTALSGDLKKMPRDVRDVSKSFRDAGKTLKKAFQDNAYAFIERNQKALTGLTKVMPLLSEAQGVFLKSTDKATRSLSKWVQSKAFTTQFQSVTKDAAGVWSAGSQALVGWAKGLLNIADAASPLVARISGFIKRTGEWASGLAAPGKKAEHFAEMLEYAGDKASQLWRMMKDLGRSLANIFKGGQESGDSLLESLEKNLKTFRDWTGSVTGQNKIKQWFKDVEPIAKSVGSLVVDLAKSLARMAADPNVAKMTDNIRTQLLPVLEKFLNNMGRTVGPQVVDLLTNTLAVLSEMSTAGGPIAKAIGLINNVVGGLADLLAAHPGMAKYLGAILGALMGYRALAFLAKMTGILSLFTGLRNVLGGGSLATSMGGFSLVLGGLTGAFSGLPGPMNGVAAALGTFLALQPLLGPMSIGLRDLRTSISTMSSGGGLKGMAKAVGTTARTGLRGALGGIATLVGGALGGPVGVGLAAVSIGVGLWAQKHAETAQAAQEYASYVNQIADSLDRETGALTEATRAVVVNKLEKDGMLQQAREYGIALDVVTDASLGNADAQSKVRTALAGTIAKFIEGHRGSTMFKDALSNAGVSMQGFTGAMVGGGKGAVEMRKRVLDAARAAGIHGAELDQLWAELEGVTKKTQDYNGKLSKNAAATEAAAATQRDKNEAMGQAKRQVDAVVKSLVGVKDKTTKVTALTEAAKQRLRDLGFQVEDLPEGRVKVTANTASANSAINNAARDRTATIHVRTVGGRIRVGGKTYNAGLMADGGIVRFADGGIRKLGRMLGKSVQSFANGAEKHIAQIARPGEWRVWAEEETGGEAYIPLASSKRGRSTEILREVASQFGYALAPSMNSLARGLSGTHRATPTSTASRPVMTSPLDRDAGRRERLIFQLAAGAVQITNPAPEPASKSVAESLRDIGEFGMGGV